MKLFKKNFISLLLLFVLIILIIGTTLLIAPKPPLLQGISFSQAVYDSHHNLLRLTLANDQQYRIFTPLTDIPRNLIEATLLQEDQYYYQHIGINPLSLLRAFWQTYILHQRKMGASTITMQVARIRFQIYSKSYWGKLEQIYRALQLERFYSKDQILEAYLNLASYGGNVEGVGAASLIYFGKPVQKLTLPETLTLAVIPQNPLRRNPKNDSKQQLKTARNNLFLRWLKLHPEDNQQTEFMNLPLQLKNIRDMPFLAPHFVDDVLQKNIVQLEVNTTLDLNLQKILERAGKNYLKQMQNFGYTNYAAMLVDTRTQQVKALIGSADFFDKTIAGQVNGTQAKRSPGSTLKPFIYALAIQQGLIHPMTVLKDAPSSFGNYNPENFDKDFVGPIKAKDALISSRNVPAVDLANQLQAPTLYQFLQQAEISRLKSEQHYGLSLVLGGAEVTMEELVTLYAMLANEGKLIPLKKLQDESVAIGKPLLTPEASFLTLDMLKDNPSPQPQYLAADKNRIPVYWKTGTSSGYRDAWAVAVFSHYVLAVWIGDFNNKKYLRYVGTEAAGPLLFAMIDAIAAQQKLTVDEKKHQNLNLIQTEVCEASGFLPTRYCTQTVKTWFIPGVSPIKTDTVFREILIDKKTGLRACHYDANTEAKVYEFWPSDLLQIFEQAGIKRRTPPPYNAECVLEEKTIEGLAPKITSPRENIVYTLRFLDTHQKLIVFNAIADADVSTLYWFVNNNYVGESTPNRSFYWQAQMGKFLVRVVDDHGRSDTKEIRVQLSQ